MSRPKQKRSGLLVLNIILLVVLLVLLLVFGIFFFTRGDENDSTPVGSSSSLYIVSSGVSSREASSTSATVSSSNTTPSASATGPTAGSIPVAEDEINNLAGSWLHHLDAPNAEGLDTYQFRFEEPAGYMMVSFGLMDSGAGYFYRGPYQFEGDGVFSAELAVSSIEAEDVPTFTVQFKVEWTSAAKDEIAITLLSIGEGEGGSTFAGQFSGILSQAVVYYKYY